MYPSGMDIPDASQVSEEDFQKFLNTIPMFADQRPEDADQHDVYNAMEALVAECTPEERAAEFKENGNDCYKSGKKFWRDAVVHYSEGIKLRCKDAETNAALLANRGLVLQKLGQHGHARADFKACVKIDPTNLKAYYRGAVSALAVRRFDEATEMCQRGLAVDGLDAKVRQLLEQQLGEINAASAKEELRLLRERRAADRLRVGRAKLDAAAQERGLRMATAFADMDAEAFAKAPVQLDEATGAMRWPVMFMYPEHMQSDFIQAFGEADRLADHMAHMFPPQGERAPWDAAGAYHSDKLEAYVLAGEEKNLPVRVSTGSTLLELLRTAGFHVPPVPCVYLVPAGSPARDAFLKEHRRK